MSEAAPANRPYAAIEDLPEGVVGELIGGQLYTQPRPSAVHAAATSRLGADLTGPFDRGHGGPGGWWILDEPELHFRLDREVLVPDIGGWRRSRMPRLPGDQRFEIVPDWICEVLSPSTASKDRETKMPVYARHGVNHAWLVDPGTERIEVYALRENDWRHIMTCRGDGPIVAPPFDAVGIPAPWR